MASINKAILIGNLGRDPEIRYTQSGDSVATLSIATSETWKDKANGEKKESTEWHRVVLFNRLAEIAGEYLKKGSQIYVEGHIRTRKWTDKDNIERYSTEIVGRELKMLTGNRDNGQKPLQKSTGSAAVSTPTSEYLPPEPPIEGSTPPTRADDFHDDVPF